jgi:hypothetical protein
MRVNPLVSSLALTTFAATTFGMPTALQAQTPAQTADSNPFAAAQLQERKALEAGLLRVPIRNDKGEPITTNIQVNFCYPTGQKPEDGTPVDVAITIPSNQATVSLSNAEIKEKVNDEMSGIYASFDSYNPYLVPPKNPSNRQIAREIAGPIGDHLVEPPVKCPQTTNPFPINLTKENNRVLVIDFLNRHIRIIPGSR